MHTSSADTSTARFIDTDMRQNVLKGREGRIAAPGDLALLGGIEDGAAATTVTATAPATMPTVTAHTPLYRYRDGARRVELPERRFELQSTAVRWHRERVIAVYRSLGIPPHQQTVAGQISCQ